jgi:hypothetical protein
VVGVDCLGTRTQEAHLDFLDSFLNDGDIHRRSNKVQGGKPHLEEFAYVL